MRLFGYEFTRVQKEEPPSFVPEQNDDGAAIVSAFGSYGTIVDLDGTVRTEAELITKYREMSLQPEIDAALEDIVTEAIIQDDNAPIVKLLLEDAPLPDNIKSIIQEEFETVLKMIKFNTEAYDIFKRYYVDGRLYYHALVDPKMPQEGIQSVRYIDPRKMRKVREITKVRDKSNPDMVVTKTKSEYYIYNESGFNKNKQTASSMQAGNPTVQGVKISKDAIIHVTSGVQDSTGTMVLSHLQKAIKPMNQLRALEDAVIIYRISRAPERRIFYIDVGNLPKAKAEQHLRDIMVKHKNKLNYDAATGEVSDNRRFMCYSFDTMIPLLDGRTLSLLEIKEEYEQGKLNWAYSCDPTTGKFMPGPISWAGATKKDAEVIRVTFDNGKSIICTPDHKFPVWNKGFVEAQHLIGESVIPGYRRNKKINEFTNEYEQIFKNESGTWEFTHREVAKWKDEMNIREELIHLTKHTLSKKNTIHHRNYNRMDNSPNNLVRMNRDDHTQYHWDMAKFGAGRRINKSSDFTPAWKAKLSAAAKNRVPVCKTWKVITPEGKEVIFENLNEYCRKNNLNRTNIKSKFGSKGYKAEELRNHKAIKVEWLAERMDVGCLTIDLEETYHSNHTYLLDVGVYTKNTMLEDYWLPRRGDGKATEITTLPAGQNLGEMSDVEFFQKRLYKSLNVPVTRLDPERAYSIGRATEITRDEIKFSRFIDRLRMRFSQLFLSLLEKQLILKMVIAPEEWDLLKPALKFKFARDNYSSELKDSEVWAERMNRLRDIDSYTGKYFSVTWVREQILKQTPEDIQRLDEEIAAEMQIPQYNPALMPQPLEVPGAAGAGGPPQTKKPK